jgi:hypothetical protein
MTNYDTKLKAIKDAYLDLGVAIPELIKLPDAPIKAKNKATGCKERVKNAMSKTNGDAINMYQMAIILNQEYSAKTCAEAMGNLAKQGYLQKIGNGTYRLK